MASILLKDYSEGDFRDQDAETRWKEEVLLPDALLRQRALLLADAGMASQQVKASFEHVRVSMETLMGRERAGCDPKDPVSHQRETQELRKVEEALRALGNALDPVILERGERISSVSLEQIVRQLCRKLDDGIFLRNLAVSLRLSCPDNFRGFPTNVTIITRELLLAAIEASPPHALVEVSVDPVEERHRRLTVHDTGHDVTQEAARALTEDPDHFQPTDDRSQRLKVIALSAPDIGADLKVEAAADGVHSSVTFTAAQ